MLYSRYLMRTPVQVELAIAPATQCGGPEGTRQIDRTSYDGYFTEKLAWYEVGMSRIEMRCQQIDRRYRRLDFFRLHNGNPRVDCL